jgi:histone H3
MARNKQAGNPSANQKSKAKKSAGSRSKKITASQNGGIKKARRFKPGTVALREIKRYQKSTDMLI